ncbi:hypothetical protein L7F22_050479 [Adiantum nelumboides]|nr:hypothetical protein [Adiantum nelumboides]
MDRPEADDEELSDEQKLAMATWFLLNSPPGEIHYVAKDLQGVLSNEAIYQAAAHQAFPLYNKEQMLSVEMSDGSGQVLVSQYGEMDLNHFIDLRTAQVATVDHVKQVCTGVRPATDNELPSAYVEEYRAAIDAEVMRYIEEAFPRGHCAVYATNGKDSEVSQSFELTITISSAKLSPKNFCNGRWRSVWKAQWHGELQTVELKGQIKMEDISMMAVASCFMQKVSAHYFEEGNVQLDTGYECKDATILQGPSETALAVATIIQHHESAYLACLEDCYSKLSDNTFKELRRKLPVTRTLFPWGSAHQLSMNREITREMRSEMNMGFSECKVVVSSLRSQDSSSQRCEKKFKFSRAGLSFCTYGVVHFN